MLATQVLSMFISNTATAVLFAPIALQAAVGLGVDPLPFIDLRDRLSKYVLYEPHRHDTQCDGHERWAVQLYGLREGRSATPGDHPGGYGMADPYDLPAIRSLHYRSTDCGSPVALSEEVKIVPLLKK